MIIIGVSTVLESRKENGLDEPVTGTHNCHFVRLFLFIPVIEWLAYHYFVMPLRHLVIAIDPTSKTSPRKILQRWSKPNLMNITIWKDRDYMAAKIVPKPGMFDNNLRLLKHRVRQMSFFRTCNAYLRRQGREWLMLVDTGESKKKARKNN